MGLFNKQQEKEMSSGAIFGYILIIFAIIVVIAFGIFVGVKKANNTETIAIEEVAKE